MNRTLRWLLTGALLGTGLAHANPNPQPDAIVGPYDEDSGFSSIIELDGNANPGTGIFTDAAHPLVGFALVGDTGDSLVNLALAPSGQVTLTEIPDAYGTQVLTFEATDDQGFTATWELQVVFDPVNDAPSFIAGGDQASSEDSGPQSVVWASAIAAGANESTQSVSFDVNNDNPGLFAAQPSIDATGNLTYQATADASGSAVVSVLLKDDGGTSNGGFDASAPVNFTLTVNPVNDAPGFVNAGDVASVEDAGPVSVPGWASALSAGPADESAQVLSFTVIGNDNPGLFATAPSVDPVSGALTFEAVAQAHGTSTITLELGDSGGTASGGIDTAAPVTFAISVADVNDVPSFTAGADQLLGEDPGPVTVPGWASSLSAGPANEAGQTLTFNVIGNDNPGLFVSLPQIDGATGDLRFEPRADASGVAVVSINVSDDGGTSAGGVNTSPAQSFKIEVTSVNDAPTFTPGANVSVLEDYGPYAQVWATGMSPGAPDESAQNLTFNIVANDNPGLFSSLPAIDATTGVLTFEARKNRFGSASITINLSDNGGTANGGIDRSANLTFTIVVTSVNDVPVPVDDTASMAEDGAPILISVLDNDDLAEEPTVIVRAGVGGESESQSTILNQTGDAVTAASGQVTIVGTSIQYEPRPDFYGVDTFTYTIRDSQGDEGTASVAVTVTPVNDPPVGVQERSYFVQENGSLFVDAATGLLVGAYDADESVLDPGGVPLDDEALAVQLTAAPTPAGGVLTFHPDGAFEYMPPVNYIGEVVFEYRLSDGAVLSADAAYRVRVVVLEAPEPPAPPPPGEVAIPFSLANVPLEQTTSVPPNVLVVMDDSGSMDWHMIVSGAGQDGGFELSNDSVSSSGRYTTSYTYMWDLPSNAYPPSSGNGRILPTEEALAAEASDRGWSASGYGVWRARTPLHNKLYYDHTVQYTPWVGQDANNQVFAEADPNAIRLDPVDPTNLFDMLALHSYKASRVPEWDSNGGTESIDVDDLYIPRYYLTTGTVPLAWNDPHTLVEIRPGAGPLPGGLFPGGVEREDCAVDDGNFANCTYEQEMQNFANYFQYYRSREFVTKNGIGKTVAQVEDVRVGYETISNTTSEPVRDLNPLYTEGNKKLLLDNIYRVDSYGGTPLRQALSRAGKIFGCETGNDCPALPAPEGFCQQNFALLFSDGYWNGGTGVSGNPDSDGAGPFDGGRYSDDISATLADVAMHYYETDIQPTLDNAVPVTSRDVDGAPAGTFPPVDGQMHQHMKTYTIAFGVAGSVNPSAIPSNPLTPFAWPDPFDGNLEKIDDMLHTAVNGRGRFLNAGSPRELQAAFESAFLEFTQAASSTSSAAFNSTSLREGTLLYRGFYDLRDNTGELTATLVDNDTGALAPLPEWQASQELDGQAPGNRVIVSYDRVGRSGIPFTYAALSALPADQLVELSSGQVSYLRGDRSQEDPAGPYRDRASVGGRLGDIVNSSPVYVGSPRSFNRDQAPYPVTDLYSNFVTANENRKPVVYVGANDGMLHGFDASYQTPVAPGSEVFGYVPNKVIDNSLNYHNKLETITSPFYQHRYFVDLTPSLNDVYMRRSPAAIGKTWNTVLIGGLGAGGKGLFALNVTDPGGTFSTEANATSAVLWEFTDEDDGYPVDNLGVPLGGSYGAVTDPFGAPVKDLGYALAKPTIAMSNVDDGSSPAEKEWTAIFGNGPNSTAGIAKLFVLFIDRGLNGWGPGDFVKVDTGVGVPAPPHPLAGYPNGLGEPAVVDIDLNGTADWVYAGDRLGNLFRFDIRDADPDNWTSIRVFTATYDTGAGETVQPILTQPLVVRHPTEQGFLVIFGTGSYLTRNDADSEDIQSIYAIWDRGEVSPATAQPDSKSLRLVEQTITNVVDDSVSPPQTRRIITKNPVNYQAESAIPGTFGWYVDLDMPRATSTISGAGNTDTSGRNPPEPQFPGEKAIRRLLYRDGAVLTTTVLPSLDEFSCFGTRPGSILVFDSATGGDPGRAVVDFNTDGHVDDADLVTVGGEDFAGGLLFNQSDLDGQLVDLSTLGGEGDTDWLFVSGGNDTRAFRIEDINDNRTGRLSWRELDD